MPKKKSESKNSKSTYSVDIKPKPKVSTVNHALDNGIEIKQECIKCKSRERKVIATRIEKDKLLPMGNGEFLKGYRRTYYECLDCGQKQIVRSPL